MGYSTRWEIWCIFYLLCVLIPPSCCGLTVANKKPCGQVICEDLQFCSPYGNICQACSDVCDPQSHNHHAETCHQQCQDYLHNLQFVKRSESARDAATLAALARDVKQLQVVAWLSLGGSVLCAALLVALCACKVNRARRRHGGLRAMIRNALHAFQGHQKSKEKEKSAAMRVDTSGLKIEIPAVPPLAQSTPTAPHTASTTLPDTPPPPPRFSYGSSSSGGKQRSPSEDATLDYAYDNPALTPSPTLVKATENGSCKRETNF